MSYVLDALKKADQKRGYDKVGDDNQIDQILNSNQSLGIPRPTLMRFVKWRYLLLLVLFIVFFYQAFNYKIIKVESKKITNNAKTTIVNELSVADAATNFLSNEEVGQLPNAINDDDLLNASSENKASNQFASTHAVSGHIYLGEEHIANKVFINGQSYRFGDRLDNGDQIVSIGDQSMVLEKGNARFTVYYYR